MTKDSFFSKKSILITGGTGSFGKTVTKKLLQKYNPAKIIIYSRDEFKQFEMKKDLQDFDKKKLRFFIGDVRDQGRLSTAMQNVYIVIHTAALKQVDAAEYNPMEYVRTNIFGAENVIKASIENGVKHIIALSTDKAVNPINLYGATKLAADKIFTAANNITGSRKTIFSVVRYGNVIGSRGSVQPLFLKLIKEGAKFLPITDTQMTRFWISIDEGVNFVLNCFERMKGGEIFIPKSPSIKIVDLAKAIEPSVKIKIIGARPGEKIHETLCHSDDAKLTLEFSDHYVIKPSIVFDKEKDYSKNNKGEIGKKVKDDFIYSSDRNTKFLNLKEINQKIKK